MVNKAKALVSLKTTTKEGESLKVLSQKSQPFSAKS